jgi:PhnB protein
MAGITPYITINGAIKAAEFYKQAFGAEEIMRQPAHDPNKLMHCHLRINGGDLLMSDPFEGPAPTPAATTLHLAVDDADRWWKRAVAAGCTVKMELADQFWGDRYGQLLDPFGHSWSIGAPIKK